MSGLQKDLVVERLPERVLPGSHSKLGQAGHQVRFYSFCVALHTPQTVVNLRCVHEQSTNHFSPKKNRPRCKFTHVICRLCVCVRVCVCVCVHMCVCARVCACMCVCIQSCMPECHDCVKNKKEVAYYGDMPVLLRLHYHLETRSRRDWHQRFHLDHQLKVVGSPDSPKVSEESRTFPWKGRNPCRKGSTSLDTGEGDLRGGMLSHQHHSCLHLGRMVLLELKK